MKIVKVILLLFLITKVSVGQSMGSLIGGDCCSSDQTEEVCDPSDSQKPSDDCCCDGPNCDCLCCAHVFVSHAMWNLVIEKFSINTQAAFSYAENQTIGSHGNIWQPPKNLQ